jgi:hypothetical protein
MDARNVLFHLKSNMLADYTRTFDKDIIPLGVISQNPRLESAHISMAETDSPTDLRVSPIWESERGASPLSNVMVLLT